MSGKRLLRSLMIVTCKPGKESRCAEEIMDLLMHIDPSVWVVPLGKGLAIGTTGLKPEDVERALVGKIVAYVNAIYVGNEICEGCKAVKKMCLEEVEEGWEAFCTGRAVIRLGALLRSKRGVIVSAPQRRSGR